MLKMNFGNLRIWQESMILAEIVQRKTDSFPRQQQYILTSQILRAAISIPSNIAEGSQRTSDKEFAHFILIAKGSLAELLTQLLLAVKFGYLTVDEMTNLRHDIERLSRMLFAFHAKLITHVS
jgi:four helix bundle protein